MYKVNCSLFYSVDKGYIVDEVSGNELTRISPVSGINQPVIQSPCSLVNLSTRQLVYSSQLYPQHQPARKIFPVLQACL